MAGCNDDVWSTLVYSNRKIVKRKNQFVPVNYLHQIMLLLDFCCFCFNAIDQ